jgi:hypothetical protein
MLSEFVQMFNDSLVEFERTGVKNCRRRED